MNPICNNNLGDDLREILGWLTGSGHPDPSDD